MKEKENIFGSILLLAQRWTVRGDAILKDKVGITTKQWMLLAILVNRRPGEDPTLSEAALEFGTSRQNLKQVALPLQKKGFVEIRHDPDDSRIQRIALTGKHEPYFSGEENEKWQHDYIQSLFRGMKKEEILSLNEKINGLVKNL